MQYLAFANGDQMPALGLGTWKADPGEVYDAVRNAIRIGYRHIDCAAIYGNEPEIGAALADSIGAGEVGRGELWITSKLWNNAHRRDDVGPALEKTLADLQLDYLDLYLIHWPVVFKPDETFPQSDDGYLSLDQVPIKETWEAMEVCADDKLVRHLGVSNFSVKKLDDLLAVARIKPEVNQVELHPFLQQPKLKMYCDSNEIHLTAYSPLGSGDRPEHLKELDEPALLENDEIRDIADKHGVTTAQILLAWAVSRGTAVIPKSINPERQAQNLAAADIELGLGELSRIQSLDRHFRLLSGSFWRGPNTPANLWDE